MPTPREPGKAYAVAVPTQLRTLYLYTLQPRYGVKEYSPLKAEFAIQLRHQT